MHTENEFFANKESIFSLRFVFFLLGSYSLCGVNILVVTQHTLPCVDLLQSTKN